MQYLVDEAPDAQRVNIHRETDTGQNALYWASLYGKNSELLRYLIAEKGMNPNQVFTSVQPRYELKDTVATQVRDSEVCLSMILALGASPFYFVGFENSGISNDTYEAKVLNGLAREDMRLKVGLWQRGYKQKGIQLPSELFVHIYSFLHKGYQHSLIQHPNGSSCISLEQITLWPKLTAEARCCIRKACRFQLVEKLIIRYLDRLSLPEDGYGALLNFMKSTRPGRSKQQVEQEYNSLLESTRKGVEEGFIDAGRLDVLTSYYKPSTMT